MDNAKNKTLLIAILRWVARIWSMACIAFVSFFVVAHIIGPDGFGTFNSSSEMVQSLFFPLGVCLGMMIAWKWEGLGGFITTASIIALHAIRPDLGLSGIDVLAAPGPLFVVCWVLSRDRRTETKEVTLLN